MGNFMQPAGEAPAEKPEAQDASVSASRVGNGSVTADYNFIGVRPSSGAASTGCSDASDSIGARSRSKIAAPEDGRTPPRRSPAVGDPVLGASRGQRSEGVTDGLDYDEAASCAAARIVFLN